MGHNNLPSKQIESLSGTAFTVETIESLMQLAAKGKPQTATELAERIETFFHFCQQSAIKPGIETLCYSLSCDRSTFWHWCREDFGKGSEWAEICRTAKQGLISYLEQAHLSGKLNPASSIFLLKNLAGYRDQIDIMDGDEEKRPVIDSMEWKKRYLSDRTEGEGGALETANVAELLPIAE